MTSMGQTYKDFYYLSRRALAIRKSIWIYLTFCGMLRHLHMTKMSKEAIRNLLSDCKTSGWPNLHVQTLHLPFM